MRWRHEVKIEVSRADMALLRGRLRHIMRPDPHAENGFYTVRSLYFDTPDDRALMEKLEGTDPREKFRIRYYNADSDSLRLEKKMKKGGLGAKESAPLSVNEVTALLRGDLSPLEKRDDPLLAEFLFKRKAEGLMPKTVVTYRREPFVFAPGSVRVTFDSDIRASLSLHRFTDPDSPTVPAPGLPALVEVKWDSFLPETVKEALYLPGRQAGAFSKYARCRTYG